MSTGKTVITLLMMVIVVFMSTGTLYKREGVSR